MCAHSLAVDDFVVSAKSLGAWRAVAKANAAALVKVPADLPASYLGCMDSACVAASLLKGLPKGAVVVQSGACSLVGLAVTQLAKAQGLVTINVVQTSTDEEDMVALVKSLGGDVVVPSWYAVSGKFRELVADLPPPALAICFAAQLDDATLATTVPACGGALSQLRPLVAGASKNDLLKLKVNETVKALAKASATHGPLAAAAPAWGADEVATVAPLMACGDLALWVENYPLVDLAYAAKRAEGPYPGFRTMVLNF
jgi:NADPH:quinone reductase-like Zn-dependent oxidoreductase